MQHVDLDEIIKCNVTNKSFQFNDISYLLKPIKSEINSIKTPLMSQTADYGIETMNKKDMKSNIHA